jgi:CRP-like cAMP-binding protein
VTVAGTGLERQLPATIMRGGGKPAIGRMAKGALLTEQGEPGHDICLLLYGVLSVRVDGRELGPDAVVGERALLADGRRSATLRAVTDCVIAAAAHQIDRGALARLAEQHHREEADR